MKIKMHDAHDRLKSLENQWDIISQGCVECLNHVPEAINFPIYIFAHPRTVEADERKSLLYTGHFDDIRKTPSTRLIWVPRATKPKAQTNSYLFLARKGSDTIHTIWLLPPRELWDNYAPGRMNHNEDIWTSIQNFQYHRERLEEPEKDGPTIQQVDEFRRIYAYEAQKKKNQQVYKKID